MTAPFWITRPSIFDVSYFTGGASLAARPARQLEALGRRCETNGLFLETLGVEEMDEDQEAWKDLQSRAMEPNAFFEPGFALSAARHFPVKSRPQFVAVWRSGPLPEPRRLVGLFPIAPPGSFSNDGLTRLWLHNQAALATPLLDRLHGVAAVEAFYDWLARTTGASGIVFPRIAMNGPVRAALSAAAAASGRETRTLDEYERAVLYPNPDIEDLWTRNSSKKALKELHRRQRRLSELGPVAFRWAVSPEEVRDATEDFLALEASGWKKQSGAFLSSPSLTAFARSATRLLAHEGKCRVATLTLAGRPMAVGLVIESGGRSFFWKIAFDEKLRAHAPGIHLLYELTRAQMARGDVDMTDGCAIANHPMIDRFWPDRIGICDLAVQLPKNRPGAFVDSCNRETLRRNLRDFAKRSLRKALGRKES